MYRRHKVILIISSASVFCICCFFKVDYSLISNLVVTIISIALAVYIAAASVLLGSPFAKELKKRIDEEDKTKSLLGVLSTYLRNAGAYSIISIIVSCFYAIRSSVTFPFFIDAVQCLSNYKSTIINVASSISCTLFFINIFFLWQILKFLINSLTKAAE